MNGKEIERFKNDPLYRFFTNKIYEVQSEIRDNKNKIKKLTDRQIELKRGKSELVKLRRELDNVNK